VRIFANRRAMKGINERGRKIADNVDGIDGIAFQTNILAPNAAVKAARAGAAFDLGPGRPPAGG